MHSQVIECTPEVLNRISEDRRYIQGNIFDKVDVIGPLFCLSIVLGTIYVRCGSQEGIIRIFLFVDVFFGPLNFGG